jgi:hypothetical protein
VCDTPLNIGALCTRCSTSPMTPSCGITAWSSMLGYRRGHASSSWSTSALGHCSRRVGSKNRRYYIATAPSMTLPKSSWCCPTATPPSQRCIRFSFSWQVLASHCAQTWCCNGRVRWCAHTSSATWLLHRRAALPGAFLHATLLNCPLRWLCHPKQ